MKFWLLGMLIVFGFPKGLSASPICFDALEVKVKTAKTEVSLPVNQDIEEALISSLANSDSPERVMQFFTILANVFERERKTQFISPRLLEYFNHNDYVGPLIKSRARLNASELEYILETLRTGSTISETHREIFGPLELLFKEGLTARAVIDHFVYYPYNAYAGLVDNLFPLTSEYNFATASFLSNLPQSVWADVRNHYQKAIETFRSELPAAKTERRNLEAIYRALHEKEFQRFLSPLKNKDQMAAPEAEKFISSFWQSMNFNSYRFKDVLRVAKIIQDGPLQKHLTTEPVFIYGSFPNGKARLPQSDIDLHLGKNLEHLYRSHFGRDGSYAKPDSPLTVEGEMLAGAFSETEALIINELEKRHGHFALKESINVGDLLTIVIDKKLVHDRDPFRPELVSFYNPIMLEIHKDQIFLRVYDTFQTRSEFRIRLL